MRNLKKNIIGVVAVIMAIISLCSCYHATTRHHDAYVAQPSAPYSDSQVADSDSTAYDNMNAFYNTHHYRQNYNFVVKADSLALLRQQPEELLNGLPTDSFYVKKGNHIVVVDIRLLKNDAVDSVWVQVARDQHTFGWVHESRLLPSVVPDDPISQFISTFSDIHLLVFLIIISVIAVSYLVHSIMQKRVKAVHFNDIDSFYPTLLALSVATSATFYSSIQMFAPETWRHFYYHPSLNPFAVPPILSIFLASVWAMVIMSIATVDDVLKKLSTSHATLYLCGLGAVCAANYIIFSITTLYYLGYALLVAYFYFAIKRYADKNFFRYVCGNCGAKMKRKGRCEKCGAIND